MPFVCHGRASGEPCIFGKSPGAKAQVPKRGAACALCSNEALAERMEVPQKRARIIKRVKELDIERQAAALALMPEGHRAHFEYALQDSWRCVERQSERCTYGKQLQKYQLRQKDQRCIWCGESRQVNLRTDADGERCVTKRTVNQSAAACVWCSPSQMIMACADTRQRHRITNSLRFFDGETAQKAWDMIPDEYYEFFRDEVPRRCCGYKHQECILHNLGFMLSSTGAQLLGTYEKLSTCLLCTPHKLIEKGQTLRGREEVATMLRVLDPQTRRFAILNRMPKWLSEWMRLFFYVALPDTDIRRCSHENFPPRGLIPNPVDFEDSCVRCTLWTSTTGHPELAVLFQQRINRRWKLPAHVAGTIASFTPTTIFCLKRDRGYTHVDNEFINKTRRARIRTIMICAWNDKHAEKVRDALFFAPSPILDFNGFFDNIVLRRIRRLPHLVDTHCVGSTLLIYWEV